MKTLSDFKKRLKIGVLLETTHSHLGSFGIRPVSIVQSNSFALTTTKYGDNETEILDGPKNSWCQFPKAKDFEVIDQDTVAIYWGEGKTREKILTYKFVDNNSTDEQK